MHPLTIWFSNHGNALRLAVIFAFGLGLMPMDSHGQSEMEAAELAKRKALVEEARLLVAKGDEAMQKQRPDLAFEAYAGAREMLPNAPALKETREAVTERFIIAALSQAAAFANGGDLKGANAMIDRVLDQNVAPKNASALKMKEMINDPVRINPTLTPEHVADVDKVNELIMKANGAIALGRFDFATQCYEDILNIDPYNVLARRGLVDVLRLKGESKIAAYDHTRAQMLYDVDKEWELEVRKPDADLLLALVDPPVDSGPEVSIEEKLAKIMIPRMALDQVNLSDAIEFLRVIASSNDLLTIDQNQRGINFNINLGPEDSNAAKAIQAKRFNLTLQNVPIVEALKHITELTGTAYRIDPFAVTIIPANQVTDEVYMRRYKVPVDFISALSMDAGGGVAEVDPFADAQPGQGLLTEQLPVQELLKRKGVSFGEGASATYNAGSNTLLLINTANNHSIVEQIIGIIKGQDPVIVSVQVTMIKTQQRNLEELGFDWLLTPFVTNAGSTVFGGGTPGNTLGRSVGDFTSPVITLPGGADAVAPGVITNGLRMGDRAFVADNLDAIINNPLRATQASPVAPGILSLTGVFDEGRAEVIMRGLSQKTGIDMMARPSVVTRSGESAKIVLAREFIYPTEYDPPELQQGGGNNQFGGGGGNAGPAFPVVPANPTAFETRDVGITMEVLPVAGPDNRLVSITLNPEIVEFDGFVNYGSPITTAVVDPLGNPARVVLTRNEILMPVFSTKRTTTQMTVADGATVVYGGLLTQSIQAVEDKVPVLGDIPWLGSMFRSKSHLPVSTAIVFLVKVDLMDPTGRPYREIGAP